MARNILALYGAVMACLVLAGVVHTATPAPLKWGPDRAFARILKVGFEAANPGKHISEAVCAKPQLPPKTGATIGVPQEDCLAIGTQRLKGKVVPLCFELMYTDGSTAGSALSCALVRKAIRQDHASSWVVHFDRPKTGFTA